MKIEWHSSVVGWCFRTPYKEQIDLVSVQTRSNAWRPRVANTCINIFNIDLTKIQKTKDYFRSIADVFIS